MKLLLKNLKQEKFTVDVEPSDTVKTVKEKVKELQGHEIEHQKLIYSGKILADDQTIESYKITEKNFVVCMVSKPKAPAVAKPAVADNPKEPSTPTPATASSTTTSSAPAPAPVAAVTQSPESGATAAAAFNDPSALATGSARESAIANMIEMGYDRQEVNRAMRAAFNNPDRAVEYLLTGIPEDLSRETAPPPPAGPETTTPATAPASVTDSTTSTPALPSTATPSQQQQQQPPSSQQQTQNQPFNMFEAAAQTQRPGGSAPSAAPAAAAAGAGIGENAGVSLDYLRDNPQFQQLRNLLQQQPQLLEPILQQLAQGNPQLATLINSQPEAFLQLLAEGGGEGVLPGEGGGEGGAGAQQIQITEAERDAIGRLEGLGFSRDLVIQAYFACDKNEELAANYLLQYGEDDNEE